MLENMLSTERIIKLINYYLVYGNNKTKFRTVSRNRHYDFDLQDVGARFYTYISSLHYIMEACAENNIPLIILDRPNPNISIVANSRKRV
jgi:uncharacterized protein YbbC (DUF1343 family)